MRFRALVLSLALALLAAPLVTEAQPPAKVPRVGVLVNSNVDRPWSQYFCCMIAADREFVRQHPVATKRALRALLKATDICASDPERVADFLVARGYTTERDDALQALKAIPYSRWRQYDVEDTVLRHAAPPRGGDDQVDAAEDHRPRHRLALFQRAEKGAERVTPHDSPLVLAPADEVIQ